jgi:hypothetical protein
VAPAGRVRLFIGQDVGTIAAYASTVGSPPGVVDYTSVAGLEGLDAQVDHGGGPMDLSALAATYPGTPIAVGLYMVGILPDILAGTYDANLDRLASVLRGFGVPVLLRIGYEFDGTWNNYQPPSDYAAAFRHVMDRMRAGGASNVEAVWQSTASCSTGDRMPWYPGDSYVDWFGLSYFDTVPCAEQQATGFAQLARAHAKPLFIAEAAPQGFDFTAMTYSPNPDGSQKMPETPQDAWNLWFSPYFQFIHDNLDVARAATYIDADWNAQPMWAAPYANGYWGDTRVQANATLLTMWNGELADGIWMSP